MKGFKKHRVKKDTLNTIDPEGQTERIARKTTERTAIKEYPDANFVLY